MTELKNGIFQKNENPEDELSLQEKFFDRRDMHALQEEERRTFAGDTLQGEERRAFIGGALSAALMLGGIYLVIFGLVIALMCLLWK